jgi:hypothetical protein
VDRRRFLMAGLSLSGIAYTCVSAGALAAGRITTDTPPVVVREAGLPDWPLFEWERPGQAVPPLLAVYADGTAYADASTWLKLPPVWVKTLHDQALSVLTTPADLVRDPPGTGADYDQVRIKAGDFLTVRLGGWRNGDPQHAYPAELRELYQQVKAIQRHVEHTGRPWRPTGVLLYVKRLDGHPKSYRAWPKTLPPPDRDEIRLPDGPHGLPQKAQSYLVGNNRFATVGWRYLLPHEIT